MIKLEGVTKCLEVIKSEVISKMDLKEIDVEKSQMESSVEKPHMESSVEKSPLNKLDKQSTEGIVKKILSEYSFRDKIKDKSIMDELHYSEINKEIVTGFIIKNYQNKVDLANQFLDICPFHYDKNGLWWRWSEEKKRWETCDDVDVLNLITECSGCNIINSKERMEIINAIKQTSRKKRPKEPKKSWIQFKDEIIDLETGNRFEASPKYFITNPISYNLGKTDKTPNMDKVFEEWVGKKYTKTLYQIISYCLIRDYPINRIFCFIGSGMNGKSKYLELLKNFIGEDNCCSTELDTLINSRFEVSRLYKKSCCLMGETNFNNMSRTSMLKKLSGGDLIGFEIKNKKPFEDMNYAKIIISTNNLPTTDDKTLGFYRRWLIIDFPNTFNEKKDILDEIPHEEYENLANKCVGLLIELLKDREFHNEGTIEERIEKFEAKSDFLQKFLDDFIEEDLNEYISKSEFYKKFCEWCEENKHRKMAENTLGKKMKEKGIDAGKKYADWLHDGKGGQMKIWGGIKWKE